MKKKTAPISLMVEPDIKKKLKDKANSLGLTLTSYLEKIATERIVFLDENAKALLEAMKLKSDM